MNSKGQIVEIPQNSPLYQREIPEFLSKKETLLWETQKRNYSLFDGFLVGEHSGVGHFKMGQRKGINVGGKKQPLYVIAIDQPENRLFVGAGENHPGLWTKVFSFPENLIQWNPLSILSHKQLENGISVEIISSISDSKIPAVLYFFEETLFLEFEKPTSMIMKETPISIFYHHTILVNTIK